jgi:amino acid transporter
MATPAAEKSALGLKRDYLSFSEVVAQSVANIAPSATPAFIAPLVSANAGNGTWLVYVFATIALVLVTYHINQFARRSASPGALYVFVGKGMGPGWGVITGWSLVIAYLLTAAATLAGAANYIQVLASYFVAQRFEIYVAAVGMIAVGGGCWMIGHKDIRLSTRAMLVLEFTSILLILVLAFAYIAQHGVVDAPQLRLSGISASGLRQGMVLAVFSFVGFESATALGHEAKDPLQSIPRSVLVSVLAVGALFTFLSYVLVMAFRGYATPLASSNAPLSVLAQLAGIPAFGIAIAIGAAISFFACALASINAGARVLYAMSRHGLLHASAGNAHETHATPHVAVAISSLTVLAIPLALLGRGVRVPDIFGNLGSAATFGFLFAYALVSIAAPMFLRAHGQRRVLPIVVAMASLGLLTIPIVGSVYPAPAPPANYLPYIFLALLGPGVAWFAYLRATRPQLVRKIEADLEQS